MDLYFGMEFFSILGVLLDLPVCVEANEPEPRQQVIEEPTSPSDVNPPVPEVDPTVPDTEAVCEGGTGSETAKE